MLNNGMINVIGKLASSKGINTKQVLENCPNIFMVYTDARQQD
jgi:hypothetical protein